VRDEAGSTRDQLGIGNNKLLTTQPRDLLAEDDDNAHSPLPLETRCALASSPRGLRSNPHFLAVQVAPSTSPVRLHHVLHALGGKERRAPAAHPTAAVGLAREHKLAHGVHHQNRRSKGQYLTYGKVTKKIKHGSEKRINIHDSSTKANTHSEEMNQGYF